ARTAALVRPVRNAAHGQYPAVRLAPFERRPRSARVVLPRARRGRLGRNVRPRHRGRARPELPCLRERGAKCRYVEQRRVRCPDHVSEGRGFEPRRSPTL
ncbi:MAG: hypothetical protein AVDCRST_MAG01-01-2505, partial [uncultured Rubrobacteraceae bacterium]